MMQSFNSCSTMESLLSKSVQLNDSTLIQSFTLFGATSSVHTPPPQDIVYSLGEATLNLQSCMTGEVVSYNSRGKRLSDV